MPSSSEHSNDEHDDIHLRGHRAEQWPNLLIIGAARSGTTALVRSLESHPDVQFTQPKETHFFAHPNEQLSYTGPGDAETVNVRGLTDEASIRKQFERSTAIVRGEGSVSTLCHAERAIPVIQQYGAPDTKVVAVLREPAARSYSAYLYLRGRGFEPHDTFEAGLDAEPSRIEAGHQHMWHYRRLSRYDEQLPAFAEAFGDRLHVMVFEEFRADPARELAALCAFLGIGDHHDLVLDGDVNRGGEPSSGILVRLASVIRRNPVARRLALALTSPEVRDRARAARLERPDADPATMATLRKEFAPARAYVEEHLGRSIPTWS